MFCPFLLLESRFESGFESLYLFQSEIMFAGFSFQLHSHSGGLFVEGGNELIRFGYFCKDTLATFARFCVTLLRRGYLFGKRRYFIGKPLL